MFKPGDIIIGNKYNGYGITCEGRKCIVVDTRSQNECDICVRVHPSDWDPECKRFQYDGSRICVWVASDKFDIWEEQTDVRLSDFLIEGE